MHPISSAERQKPQPSGRILARFLFSLFAMTTPRVQSAPRQGETDSERPALHVVTFGCQMNKYDSLVVEGRFVDHGYRLAPEMADADVVLFNTCSVREHAEERVYSWVGELKRVKEEKPELVIGVMGCMAQRAEEEIFRRAAHVDVVCGTRRLQELPSLVDEVRERRLDPETRRGGSRLLETNMAETYAMQRLGEAYTGGLVGHLAIMRGCDLNCTYCIVPRVRGRVQSRSIPELVEETRWMVAGGARVVTLLGQTVNSYGEELDKPGPGERKWRGRQGRPSLADLLRELQEVEGLERIRLITLHPAYVTKELAQAIADCDKVDRFLPLPAQSGSDDVLRRMKRGYTVELYRDRLALLRGIVPDIELGSDWIVGFPGESDADYAASEAFLEEVGFVQNYVFKYDPRPGTKAAEVEDDVSLETKKTRNRALLALSERVSLGRHERWIGQEVDVFVDSASEKRPGTLRGTSHHGLPVSFRGEDERVGTNVRVKVGEASPFGLAGELV